MMKLKIFFFLILTASLLFAQSKRKIGFIPFENEAKNPKYDWVSYGLEYLFLTKVSVLSSFYVPEKNIFKKSLTKSGFGSRPIDERMIYHIGKSSGVQVTVSGKYKVTGQTLQLEVVYSNAFNGSAILKSNHTKPLSDLFIINRLIIDELINLAGNGTSDTEKRLLGFTLTNSIQAFEGFVKAYMENEKKNSRIEVVTGLFRKAISKDPNFWEAYYNLGIVYFNSKKYNDALKQFNKVINALPNFDKSYYGRGLIYEKQKKYKEAIADFKKVTEFNPNDYKPYYYLGKISVLDGNYKEAQENLNKAKEINPEFAPINYELGNIYYNQNLYRKAIDYYKRAVELDDKNATYHLKLGDTFYRSQIYYNAYNELKASLALRPNDPIAHFLLGVTVYKQAVLEELVDTFLDLLSNNNEKVAVKEKKFKKKTAIDPVKKRQVYEDMADAFTKASQANPKFMEATFNLALTYHEMGNPELAEKYYKKTLQINPNLIRAYMKLAELYTDTKRRQLSIDEYRKAFQLEPAIFVRQQTLGEEHQYINVYKIFRQELENKLQRNPNDPRNNLVLAKIFKAQGHNGKAANLLRKILTFSPSNREAKNLLAKLKDY